MSLFSGIEGLGLGVAQAIGGQLVGFVEQEKFCHGVLSRHYPGVPIWTDVREVGAAELPQADVLVGGFPCQDISVAGRGAGLKEGTRSGLFFEMWRIALELEPRFVVFENVPAIKRRGLDVVSSVIASDGWTLEWRQLSAAACGARHLRNRWFAIAHREDALVMHRDGGTEVGRLSEGGWVSLQASLFGSPDEVEEMPSHGYVCSGRLYRSELRGSIADGYGLWPTPRASENDQGSSADGMATGQSSWKAQGRGATLSTAARLWPTPNGGGFNDGEDPGSWLERKRRIKEEKGFSNGMPLGVAARLWPTPTTRTESCIGEDTELTVQWSTPTTMDSLPPKSQEVLDREATGIRAGRLKPGNLRDQVNAAAGNVEWRFPTPRAQEPGVTTKGYGRGLAELVEGKEQRWVTPVTTLGKTSTTISTGLREAARHEKTGVGMSLWTQVCERLPTPNSRDWKDTYSSQEALDNRESHQESLATRAQKMEGVPGRLNPDWVDVLMGFPQGYSCPEGEPVHGFVDPACWQDGTWEDGISRLTEETRNRAKRLKALGNSVVPHQAYAIGLCLRDKF